MDKEFFVGQPVIVLYSRHDCEADDGEGRFATDIFDTNTLEGTIIDGGSNNDDEEWGAIVELPFGEEWLDQAYIITEDDLNKQMARLKR